MFQCVPVRQTHSTKLRTKFFLVSCFLVPACTASCKSSTYVKWAKSQKALWFSSHPSLLNGQNKLVFNRENSKNFHLYLWVNLTEYFQFSPIFKRISEITVRQLFNLLRKFFANDFVDFFDMALKRKYLLRFSCLYLTNQKLFSYEIVVMLVFLMVVGIR